MLPIATKIYAIGCGCECGSDTSCSGGDVLGSVTERGGDGSERLYAKGGNEGGQ